MDYVKVYNQIIERGLNRDTVEGYSEKHHIVPKCIGGGDEKSNIVRLTAREHFVAHWLLARIHDKESLWFAFFQMCVCKDSNQNRYTPSSRAIAEAKENKVKLLKGKTFFSVKGMRKMYNKDTDTNTLVAPEDVDSYLSKGFVLGTRPHSKETKNKISNNRKGKGLGKVKGKGPQKNSEHIDEIRILLDEGVSPKDIAEKFNMTRSNIYTIKNKKSWIA